MLPRLTILLLLTLACSTGYTPARPVILRDVVVHGHPGMIVIIEGDTILGVEHAAGVVPPPGSEIIEGNGRVLRPAGTPIEDGRVLRRRPHDSERRDIPVSA